MDEPSPEKSVSIAVEAAHGGVYFGLQGGLAFFRGQYSVEWHLLMAATLVTMLPCLVVYFLAQKHLIGGIASVGLKG